MNLREFAGRAVRRLFNSAGLEIRRRPKRLDQLISPASHPASDTEEILQSLDARFRAALLSLYRGEPQLGVDGQRHPIDPVAGISPSQGMWLYELLRKLKPHETLEIGMGYGFSTLFILAATIDGSHHTAIDPFQRSHWSAVGLANVQSLGAASSFRFIEERSDRSAVDLARESRSFDLIFIDGNHRFDDVLVDFYLYAELCRVGGMVIFDDTWMSSVQSVLSFIRNNRSDFRELRTPESNVALFEKIAEDARLWMHFRSFRTAPNS
jgi:predicted O-methyltransferase YrrM